jgi:uncharacterized protein with von Willebrand factor type A (vWA) domain
MPDPHVLVRVIDELLWVLRREGFDVSTSQAIDALRAVTAVGLERRADVRDAIGAIVVHRARDRDRFDAAFDSFFTGGDTARDRSRTFWERLSASGFDDAELNVLRNLMAKLEGSGHAGAPFDTLLGRGADLDRVLARWGAGHEVDAHSALQLGFLTHRLLSRTGAGAAWRALASLRALLAEALGVRGERIADALAKELEQTEAEITAFVRRSYEASVADLERRRQEHRPATTPFVALTDVEIEEVRRAVRRFAERLRGGARVRARRRALKGRIDAHRTFRRAQHTGGVPFQLVRKQRRRNRPKLIVLCDVSDSVRAAAGFLLEFTYAVQELFSRTRSFVFVSDLGETTQLFEREPVRTAIALAWGDAVMRAGDNSNYGRVLRSFERQYGRALDRRTTVVVLGDGRTNYHDAAADALDRIRERSRALLWLCPEPRGHWGHGDSAMPAYARRCTAVYEVRCAADLERAARAIVARG